VSRKPEAIQTAIAVPRWRKIRGQIPESLIAADMDSDGKDELVADFGPGTGLLIYRDIGGEVWQWTTESPPSELGIGENSSPGALAVAELGTTTESATLKSRGNRDVKMSGPKTGSPSNGGLKRPLR